MRDNQQAPAVFLLEGHQFHHEQSGDVAFLAAVAEVGQVVDNDDSATGGKGCFFDVVDDVVFVVLGVDGFGANLCA